MLSPALQSWQDALNSHTDANAERRDAFAKFLARGLPTPKQDDWKFTDLRRLTLKPFRLGSGAPLSSAIEQQLIATPRAIRLIFVDGVLQPPLSNGANIESGIELSVEPFNESNESAPFALLNTALAAKSYLLTIPDDCALVAPIYLAHVWTAAANGLMSHPRVRLRLGRHATATVIEHHCAFNTATSFTNAQLQIELAELARLDHACVQDDAAVNFGIGTTRARIASGAAYRHFNYVLGGALTRANIVAQLTGRDASIDLNGLILAQQTQHLDVHTTIEHAVPHTRSLEDYRGIADQRGRVVFTGKVIVTAGAQKTDAAQSSRNLLLSPHAEVDTRPVLEIYANDVKCAHGATVGQLDAAALFYLRSRGLSHEEARALLTHAFAAEVIERAPLDEVRDYVLKRLMPRLRTEATR